MLLPHLRPIDHQDFSDCINDYLESCNAMPNKYSDLLLTIDTLEIIREKLSVLKETGETILWIDAQWIDCDDEGRFVDLAKAETRRYGLALVARMLADHFKHYKAVAFMRDIESSLAKRPIDMPLLAAQASF